MPSSPSRNATNQGLRTLEQALEDGVNLRRGRVFADLWDLEEFSDCATCFTARRERLRAINQTQRISPSIACACQGAGA